MEGRSNRLSLPTSAIEGIGPQIATELQALAIFTVADLLRVEPGRLQKSLKSQHSLSETRSWYHMAAFLQIRAMTPQWAEALVRVKAATCRDLRSRDLPTLTKLFTDAKKDGKIPEVPDAATIAEMMREAAVIEFTGALNGTLLDQADKPVSGASVRVGQEQETSDERGRFRVIRIPFTAKSTLAISHPECRPATLRLRKVESPIFPGAKVFRIRRLPPGRKAPKHILMEARGDVLPPVGDARISTREVERQTLLDRDLLTLTELSADKQRGKLVSKLLVYEEGEFWLPYIWVPLADLEGENKSGDCFVLRRKVLVKIRMNAMKLRGWPAMIRTARRLGPPPKDADAMERWLKKGVEMLSRAGKKRERI